MRNYFIAKLRTYNVLTDEAVLALEQATSRPRTLPAKRDLICEGDRPDFLFIVLDGWVMRYKLLPNGTRQILAFLMPGDCCDIRSDLLAAADHNIVTITTAKIASITHTDVENVIGCHSSIAKAMYITQLVDHASTRSLVTSIGRRDSVQRLGHLFLELYARALNVELTTDNTFNLPISQIQLSDALGMTPVHLNRVLGTLRKEGLIVFSAGVATILNVVRLAAICGFDENYLHGRLRVAV